MVNTNLIQKCKKIKIILTDVDGVLTDGGRYYSDKGEILKKFHVRDGMGVNLLLRNGIKTIIVTKENSTITKKWAKKFKIQNLSGIWPKINILVNILTKLFYFSMNSHCTHIQNERRQYQQRQFSLVT